MKMRSSVVVSNKISNAVAAASRAAWSVDNGSGRLNKRGLQFEPLEARVLFTTDLTVASELLGDTQSNASYMLDLAAGATNSPPPATQPAPTPQSAPTTNTVVSAPAPVTGTGGTSSGESGTSNIPQPLGGSISPSEGKLARSPSDFRYVLQPGSGFTGATTQPATVGNPAAAGYDAKAIARWDVVPYQTFTDTINVGVVAFHREGIDRVEFSVNGGNWTPVRTTKWNPQTSVYEYTATLRASDFADGVLEVRAIAYPKVGEPRVLAGPVSNNGSNSLVLYANGNGSLQQKTLYVATTGNDTSGNGTSSSPYATLKKAVSAASSGTMIRLNAGTYQFTNASTYTNNDRWITITTAPGVSRSSVIIQPNQKSLVVNHLAVSGVTVDCIAGYDFEGWKPGTWNDNELWIDNCDISSSLGKSHTPEIGAPIQSGWTAAYLTSSAIHDYPGRAVATPNVHIIRNVQITNIGDDAIDNPQLVVNTTIRTVVGNDAADHIDAIQYFPDHSDMNSIVFNVEATSVDGQLLFGGLLAESQGGPAVGTFSNVAVVNFLGTSLQGPIANSFASQIGGNRPSDHLLFMNVTMPNQTFFFLDDTPGATFSNTVVAGSVVWRLYDTAGVTGHTIRSSHIIDFAHQQSNLPVGDFTIGDPGFIASVKADGTYSPSGDFHLGATSVLRNRLSSRLFSVDLENVLRRTPDSIGAYGN